MAQSMTPIPLLFLTYYFPPIGGPGVQRSLKFVRYLAEEGFEPIVVAGPGMGRDRWEPEDASLAGEIPDGLALYRPSSAPPPGEASSTRLTRLLGRSTPRFRWWREQARAEGLAAARKHGARAVFITASPFEGISAAADIAESLGLPVVADLRDPWALDETISHPTGLHRSRQLRLMRRTLARVDRILMNTPEAREAVQVEFPELGPRCAYVTNGYDEADFEGVARGESQEEFVIVFAGFSYSDIGLGHSRYSSLRHILGGEPVPVDLAARSPLLLLEAIETICRDDPRSTAAIRFEWVGQVSVVDRERIARSPVASRVRLRGQVPHAAAIEAMVSADLLFLPMHGLPTGYRARMVPGKLYEYLASGRPVLAAVPEGDARDFITSAGAGRIVRPGDHVGLVQALREFLREGPVATRPRGPEVSRFERRLLTKQLASHLSQCIEAHRLESGARTRARGSASSVRDW